MTVSGSGHHFLSIRRSFALVMGIVLIYGLLMWLTKDNPTLRSGINALMYFLVCLGVTISLFYVAFRFRQVWHVRLAWGLLGAGLSLGTVGTILYTIIDPLGQGVFPSIADIFYLVVL